MSLLRLAFAAALALGALHIVSQAMAGFAAVASGEINFN